MLYIRNRVTSSLGCNIINDNNKCILWHFNVVQKIIMGRISQISETVKYLLNKYASLRDDDKKLVFNTHALERPEIKSSGYLLSNYIKLIYEDKLTSWDSITRARRKLQEENEHLRGKLWKPRHNKQEEAIKDIANIQ
jgi:hypothetical protein